MRAIRRGFSLAEIMVALVILSVIIMGLATTTVSFLHETTLDGTRVRAAMLADTRVAELRGWPEYTDLVSFNETKSNWPAAGWSRVTKVVRDTLPAVGCHYPTTPACPSSDITRVIVTVTAPGLSAPVVRDFSVSAVY